MARIEKYNPPLVLDGGPLPYRRWSEEDALKILQKAQAEGWSLRRTANRYGIAYQTLHRHKASLIRKGLIDDNFVKDQRSPKPSQIVKRYVFEMKTPVEIAREIEWDILSVLAYLNACGFSVRRDRPIDPKEIHRAWEEALSS